MTYDLTVHALAMSDLAEAQDWYERQQPGLGDELMAEVSEAFARLETSPEAFPIYYRGLRRLLMRRFPYKVFYRVEQAQVIVFRVLHTSRDHRREFDA